MTHIPIPGQITTPAPEIIEKTLHTLEYKLKLTVGIVLPASLFRQRSYKKQITNAVNNFHNQNSDSNDLLKYYEFGTDNIIMSTMPPSSSPTSEWMILKKKI